MKILVICGSVFPTYCGIGKFTNKLIEQTETLSQGEKIDWVYLTDIQQPEFNPQGEQKTLPYKIETANLKLKLASLRAVFEIASRQKPDQIWIQYQTFAKNVFDSLFPLVSKIAYPKAKTQIFIHEFAGYSRLGKLRLYLAMLLANQILFSDHQQLMVATTKNNILPTPLSFLEKAFQKLINKKSQQILIGAHVDFEQLELHLARVEKKGLEREPLFQELNQEEQLKNTKEFEKLDLKELGSRDEGKQEIQMVFHGFIQEAKGLHLLFEALEKFSHPFKIHILGSFEPLLDYANLGSVTKYQQDLLQKIKSSPKLSAGTIIYGDVDPSSQKFVEIINLSQLAIFPFLDFATMRRSTLMNCLVCAPKTVFATTLDPQLSDVILTQNLLGFQPNTHSILQFLENYAALDYNAKTLQIEKQKNILNLLRPDNISAANYKTLFS